MIKHIYHRFWGIIYSINPGETAMLKTVDEYISNFPTDVQRSLQSIRQVIKEIAPTAIESIAYGMPAYKIGGKPLIYFAGFKNHIGLYPTPSGISEFSKEISQYKQGKGSIQFPLVKPIPIDLIKKIVKFREEKLTKSREK
jgi:uncharacterized protein YdhG (YjbR/CyaY superfamily)